MGITLDSNQASAVVVASAFCRSNRVLFTRIELAEVKPSDIDIYPIILLGESVGLALDKRVLVVSIKSHWLHDEVFGHYSFKQTEEGVVFTKLVEKKE